MPERRNAQGGSRTPDDHQITALKERIISIDTRLDRLDARLDGIDTRLRAVEVKLGEIGGKLDLIAGKIPSWWNAPVSAAGLLALLLGALALSHHLGMVQ